MLINLLPLVSVMTLLDPVRKAAISIFLFRVTVVYTTMLPLTLSYRRLHDSFADFMIVDTFTESLLVNRVNELPS